MTCNAFCGHRPKSVIRNGRGAISRPLSSLSSKDIGRSRLHTYQVDHFGNGGLNLLAAPPLSFEVTGGPSWIGIESYGVPSREVREISNRFGEKANLLATAAKKIGLAK